MLTGFPRKIGGAAEHLCTPSNCQGWTVQNTSVWLGHTLCARQLYINQGTAAMPNVKVNILSGSLFVERMHAC